MTVEELKSCKSVFVYADDIAPIIGASPQLLRQQAHIDASLLGFPVAIVNHQVRIPRKPFLRFIGEDV